MLLAAIALFASPVVHAQWFVDANRLEQLLRAGPAAEMPAAAARLLHQARLQEREAVATNLVKVAARVRPAATAGVVAALCREEPNLAATIAEVAAQEQPLCIFDISRAASACSPGRAGQVVEQLGRLAPDSVQEIAVASSEAAPAQAWRILLAVGAVQSELRPYLDTELARYGSRLPQVRPCLDRATQAMVATRPVGTDRSTPPVTPATRPGDKPPKGGGGPPGGRNYAKP